MRKQMMTALLSGLMLAMALPSLAASITLNGDHFDFTFDDTLLGLFGTPTVTGDTLSFAPTAFEAQATNDGGAALTTGTVNITVTGRDGRIVPGLRLEERGDYLRIGETTELAATGQFRVTGGPGIEVTDPLQTTSPFVETGLATANWQALASVDLTAWDASEVLATVQNVLVVRSFELGDIAFIQKKRIDVTVIPLPPAVWLLGSSLLALVTVARRRQRAV